MTSVRASCVSIGIVTGARSSTVILDEERSGFEGQVAVNHDANPLQSGAGDRERYLRIFIDRPTVLLGLTIGY